MKTNTTTKYIIANGGVTLLISYDQKKFTYTASPITFSEGYQVSVQDVLRVKIDFLEQDSVTKVTSQDKLEALISLVSAAIPVSGAIENYKAYIGLWRDTDTNELCVDLSVHIFGIEEAQWYAKTKKQKAIYDWANNKSIYL